MVVQLAAQAFLTILRCLLTLRNEKVIEVYMWLGGEKGNVANLERK